MVDVDATSLSRWFKWRQQYYFYIHIAYFALLTFFGGLVYWGTEGHTMQLSFVDALFAAASACCLAGFVVMDISKLSVSGQITSFVLMIMGGITFTTIPAMLIRTVQAYNRMLKRREELKRDTSVYQSGSGSLSPSSSSSNLACDEVMRRQTFDVQAQLNAEEVGSKLKRYKYRRSTTLMNALLSRPPPITDVEYLAHITLLVLVCLIVVIMMVIGWIVLALLLKYRYTPAQIDNHHPWWIGLYLSVAAFNNSGLTLFSDGLVRFATDYPINITLIVLMLAGNTCFPALLRTILVILYKVWPRWGLVFRFLLTHHHHISIHLFPALQTRVYFLMTIVLQVVGTSIGLLMESDWLYAQYQSGGVVFMIMFFQSVSTRAAGFNTIDFTKLSIPTLVVYAIMMRVKPQMFCSLDEQAYNIAGVEKQIQQKKKAASEMKVQQRNQLEQHQHKLQNGNAMTPIMKVSRSRTDSDFRKYSGSGWMTPRNVHFAEAGQQSQRTSLDSRLTIRVEPPPPELSRSLPLQPVSYLQQQPPLDESQAVVEAPNNVLYTVAVDRQPETVPHAAVTIANPQAGVVSIPAMAATTSSIASATATDMSNVSLISETTTSTTAPELVITVASYDSQQQLRQRKSSGAEDNDNDEDEDEEDDDNNDESKENINFVIDDLLGDSFDYQPDESISSWQQIVKAVRSVVHRIWKHFNNIFISNNTWLVIVVLLICMIESDKMYQDPTHYSFFKVLFEVISAFGDVGLSMGYPNSPYSFAGVLYDSSKMLLILVMLIGRHRGLSSSMKDQEYNVPVAKRPLKVEAEESVHGAHSKRNSHH